MQVHRSAILIDTHNDITSATVAGLDLEKPNTDHMTDIPRMKRGGMGAQFFAAYVAASYVEGNHSANRTLQMIDTIKHDIVEGHPDDFVLATTAADVRRAHREGKMAALIGIEGGVAIEDDLAMLRAFHRLGARYMTLTHNTTLAWADAAVDEPKSHGLSPFGERVVREMNRLGILVDISHVSPATMAAALRVSEAPVIASTSEAFSRSVETTMAITCVSNRQPLGKSGRDGRSMRREVSTSTSVMRPSRLK